MALQYTHEHIEGTTPSDYRLKVIDYIQTKAKFEDLLAEMKESFTTSRWPNIRETLFIYIDGKTQKKLRNDLITLAKKFEETYFTDQGVYWCVYIAIYSKLRDFKI